MYTHMHYHAVPTSIVGIIPVVAVAIFRKSMNT